MVYKSLKCSIRPHKFCSHIKFHRCMCGHCHRRCQNGFHVITYVLTVVVVAIVIIVVRMVSMR